MRKWPLMHVSAVAEYYIEIGKLSSAPLGAMGDRLCKGLEAANCVEPGPVGHDRLDGSSRVESAQ